MAVVDDALPTSEHSSATVRLTAAQALVCFLSVQHSKRDGVRRRLIPAIFGIFGHGNVAGVGQALQEYGGDLPFHQPKNEQSAVHAAIGYAKASDRLATLACTTSIGPGSTNLVTGAATATVNRLPVLLLPSDTFATRRQGSVLQQLEAPYGADVTVNDSLRPVSAHFDRVARPEQLLAALPEAMRALLDPALTGAVTLALHQDVQGEAYEFPVHFFEPRTWRVTRRPPADEELEPALDLLRSARRPLIIAGGGVRYSGAQAELSELSAAFGVPVCETSAGKGVLPRGDLLLGGVGVNGTRAANELARQADVVVTVGTRLTDFTTASRSLFADPDVRFVGVNVCEPDAHKLGALPVVADAKVALIALTDRLGQAGWSAPERHREHARQRIGDWSRELESDLAPRDGERMSQGQVLRVLNEEARRGDVVIGAAGSTPGDLLKSWDCSGGATVHIEFGYSCMGHELPAGLGYRLAGADGEVYVVIGDGTYLMANTELVTAVQEGLKITLVIVVNGGYQSIHALQEATTGQGFGNEFRRRATDGELSGDWVTVDYAANVRSLGCEAFDTKDLDEFRGALHRARDIAGPVAVIAHVEPRRGLLHAGAWWDLGIAEVSGRGSVRHIAAARERAAAAQRLYQRGDST